MSLNFDRLSSLGEALFDATVTYKTNVALIEADRKREAGRWTYQQLRSEAERFGALIQGGGFEAGQRCAILMSNQARWLMSATGAFWSGATLVPLDYKLTPKEQVALLLHCKPEVLVTEYGAWLSLSKEPTEIFRRTRVLVTEAPEGADLGPAERWEQTSAATFELRHREREDVACIVYSSGTGGTPKGCQLTHANYLAQAEVLGNLFPLTEPDRYFSILPTNHAIDFMCGFFLPLQFGAAVVHQRTLRPQFLGPTMRRYGITHMAVVPMLLKKLEERIREKLDDLPPWKKTVVDSLITVNGMATKRGPKHALSKTLLKPIHDEFGKLQLMFCGGAFVDRSIAEFFYSLGLPVCIGYGLTEAGTVLTVNDLKPFRGDTVGKAVRGVTLEIRNPNDAGVGEVWAKGPTVMKGYLNEPDLTSDTIVDGWLKTGDLGIIDAAGHLKLMGRSKNMIVTEGGKNVYPEDLEAAFDGVEGVEELCVFAANYVWPTGKLTEEQLMVVLRGTDGKAIPAETLAEIRKRNRRLADFKRLAGYVEWGKEFPRTASMKVKRTLLAAELAQTLDRASGLVAL